MAWRKISVSSAVFRVSDSVFFHGDFYVRCIAQSLKECPLFNSSGKDFFSEINRFFRFFKNIFFPVFKKCIAGAGATFIFCFNSQVTVSNLTAGGSTQCIGNAAYSGTMAVVCNKAATLGRNTWIGAPTPTSGSGVDKESCALSGTISG